MNTKPIISLLAGALALAGVARADDQKPNQSHKDAVTVEFMEPEKFTDFATTRLSDKKDRQALQQTFRSEIKRVADRYLPPDHRLQLRFRDINMAGEFEPQAGPELDDVRFMRSIYPPSFLVEYEVTDASGNVVTSGQRRMTDLGFQNIVSIRRDEQLFYETELVTDLLRDITRSL